MPPSPYDWTVSVAEAKRQQRKKDQRNLLMFRAGMVGLLLGMFGWMVRSSLLEASVFLAIGAAYSFLVWRVASQSVRAVTVMSWSLMVNFWTLISIDNQHLLAVPASGPWFVGILAGGMAAGSVWLGPHAGAESAPKNKRRPDADGKYSGGRRLALINGACAALLLGIGTAAIVLLSPPMPAGAVLVASFFAGWMLFRFPPALPARNGLVLLGTPAVFVVLVILGGTLGLVALPYSWAYGVMAGILIGGRHWAGDRLGAPRPPFNSQHKRRRRRKPRKKRSTPSGGRSQPHLPAQPFRAAAIGGLKDKAGSGR